MSEVMFLSDKSFTIAAGICRISIWTGQSIFFRKFGFVRKSVGLRFDTFNAEIAYYLHLAVCIYNRAVNQFKYLITINPIIFHNHLAINHKLIAHF